ncbi:UNVERIFIED_CONTAM: hypothetical protein HDU68_001592, partial [Siphonaria sp. JEL0065]
MDAFAKSSTGYTTLEAHGLAVGLPEGLMGNSEVCVFFLTANPYLLTHFIYLIHTQKQVGHLNIGAGRVVYQDIVRIDLSLKNKTLGSQPHLAAALSRAASSTGTG